MLLIPTVLVTGATGFVGRRLVDCLLNKKVSVRVLRQGPLPIPRRWLNNLEVREGDLTQPTTLRGIAMGIETVYHLAGEIRVPNLFGSVNRLGTEHLLRTCKSEGVMRFLYFSSVGVIGASGRDEIVDETAPPDPKSAYEKSKYAGERISLSYHQDQGMNVTIVRPSTIFGEGKDAKTDRFYSLLRMIDAGRFVLLAKKYINTYIYVGDVVEASIMLANHPQAGGQVYIVNEPISLREFVDEISRILGRTSVPVLPFGIGNVLATVLKLSGRFGSLYNKTVFSMDKLSRLGFQLPFGHSEGLKRTIAWYRAIRHGEIPKNE